MRALPTLPPIVTRRHRARGVLVALVSLLLVLLVSATADAGARHSQHPKPTIVLVHGAWADSSSWSGVVRRLQREGYTVDVPPNPLRSLAGDAAYISAYVKTITGPVVLVGHSYGGAVITNAALGNPQIKALVYVNAFIPDQGESVVQLAGAQPGSALAVADPTAVFKLVSYPGAPAGDFDAYILPSVFRTAFANDLGARQAAVLAATQRPATLSALGTPSGPPAWKSIPSWAFVGTLDHVLPPAEQQIMAQRAGSHITRVRASHLSMISRPGDVTDVILGAAHSVH